MDYNIEVRKGDVHFADMSGGIGAEQRGFRPVLIIQNDTGNRFSPTTFIAPLTASTTKKRLPTHVEIKAHECGLRKASVVMLEQARVIDKSRLKGYYTSISNEIMTKVDTAIAIEFGLAIPHASSVVA